MILTSRNTYISNFKYVCVTYSKLYCTLILLYCLLTLFELYVLYVGRPTPIILTDYHHQQQQQLVKPFTSFISVIHSSPIVMTESDRSDVVYTREIACEMGYGSRHVLKVRY